MHAELLVLRIVHVVGSILWGGTAMFVAFFLMPAMGMAGPAGAPVMGALVKRRLFVIVPTVAVLTILAGLRLLWLASSGLGAAYWTTRSGMTYAIGAVCGIAAFTVFLTVSRPALGQMGQLQQQLSQASDAEREAIMSRMAAVRGRAAAASQVIALLLIIAAITMAVGRYVD
ncbi:MAG: hypothetical protein ACYC7F_07015 [Gemmatimonadaceae bacterium]